MLKKYVTYVVEAADESAARALVPGSFINGNRVVGVSLGDVLSLSDHYKELISEDKIDEAEEFERQDIAPFYPKKP